MTGARGRAHSPLSGVFMVYWLYPSGFRYQYRGLPAIRRGSSPRCLNGSTADRVHLQVCYVMAHFTRERSKQSTPQKVQYPPFFSNQLPFTPVCSRSLPFAPVCALIGRLPSLTSKSGALLLGLSGTRNARSGFSGFDPQPEITAIRRPASRRPGRAGVSRWHTCKKARHQSALAGPAHDRGGATTVAMSAWWPPSRAHT